MKDTFRKRVLTEDEQKAFNDATAQLDKAVQNFPFEVRGYIDSKGRTCVPAEDFFNSDWPAIDEADL